MSERFLRGVRFLILTVSLAPSCRGGSPESRPPAKAPPSSEQAPEGLTRPGAGDAAAIAVGMPRIAPVLDDPRLAAARDLSLADDEAGAAREVERVHATAVLDAATDCEWTYVAGRLHLAAGEASEAVAQFERVSSLHDADAGYLCVLSPYAALRDAQALARLGRFEESAQAARTVGDDTSARDEATFALAEALAAKGDRASAVPLWRSLLGLPGGSGPVPSRAGGGHTIDVSLHLAGALLDGADGPPEAHAAEAMELATRVLVESPMIAEKVDVAALRARAAAAANKPVPVLTPAERVRQAQAYLDAAQPRRARDAAETLLKSLRRGDKTQAEVACRAAIVVAQATPHGKSDESADAWGAAIARCEGDDALVTALFYGGKASVSASRPTEAIARFERVEKVFPKHRLADDARLRGAAVVQESGDVTRALSMLESLPDAYPEGDMRAEALFRVAVAKLLARDWEGAEAALDRSMSFAHDDRGAGLGGRGAYFRARAAQLAGDVADARARYASLVEDEPLGYYMLLGYARLRAIDEGFARSTRDAVIAREESAAPAMREHGEHVELKSPAFDRFVRLLEVGEVDAARHEASAGGLLAEGVDPDVLWTIAYLYDRAGAPELGHALTRSRLTDYRAHWPAGPWRLAWETAFPRPWEGAVIRESDSAHIPASLTWAIMREESAFNPDARSPANAIGLMQLLVGTARQVAKGSPLTPDEDALRRPEVSISLGARFLSSLRASFAATPALAIAAYNGGSGAVRRWLVDRGSDDFDLFVERIPFDETRGYIKRVLASEAAYAYLYAPAAFDDVLALPAGPVGKAVATFP
jgi:soluble lytic murein transglycosylase